jgi:hypothetical protein
MSRPPFIDAYEVAVCAPPQRVWEAAGEVAARFGGRFGPIFARVLGCTETASDFPRTVVGFRVATADPPTALSLLGEHRFSRYRLDFVMRAAEDGMTYLRAETRAEFPGAHGRAYRALVIGSRIHVLAVGRMLDAIRRRAER